jgi:hypothetical protein
MKSEEKKRLEKVIRDARNKIDADEDIKRISANKKLIGKCFRCRNSYGGGEPSWWLYKKITGMKKNGNLFALTFEDDTEGRINIHHEEYYHEGYILDSELIPDVEFRHQWELLMDKLNGEKI